VLQASAVTAWAQGGTAGRARAAAAGAALDVTVTDGTGAPLKGVRVTASGPVTRDATTNENGGVKLTGLKAGAYRLRFDGEAWVSLEREVTVTAKTPTLDVNATLTAAPPPPPPPPPPAPVKAPVGPDDRLVGESRVTDVADYADRNLIRSGEPQKTNVFGCTGYSTTRLVQIRDPLENRQNDDADETLYVLAGEGVIAIKGRQENVTAGVLAVIPRGTESAITRRSRGPLILISVMSGPPCKSDR
jgi:mannose-6-phosphate isomerase-like protein (cupin superfamily)